MTAIPTDWPVQPIGTGAFLVEGIDPATCGVCGRIWGDAKATSLTPVPSGRCPFEPFHDEEPDQAPIVARVTVATPDGVVVQVIDVEVDPWGSAEAHEELAAEVAEAVHRAAGTGEVDG